MEKAPLTIAIINYNGMEVLGATLDAVFRSRCAPFEVLLLDDGSDDGSVEWVRQRYPRVRVERMRPRAAKPSSVRNRALQLARTPYVLLLDHDVAPSPDCAGRLMALMLTKPGRVLGVAPRLVCADRPDTLYADGSDLHFLCISGFSARGLKASERPLAEPFPSLLAGNALLDREAALSLGGYDEAYLFGWGEDAELGVRGRLAGYETLHVPAATARHVERGRGTARAEAQYYNRYRMLLTMYSARSLLLLAPALVLFEICLLAVGLIKGVLWKQVRAMARVIRGPRELMRTRRRIQRMRKLPDTAIVGTTPMIPAGELAKSRTVRWGAAVLERVFAVYWRLIYRPWTRDDGAQRVPMAPR